MCGNIIRSEIILYRRKLIKLQWKNKTQSNEIVGILLSPIEVLSDHDERISLLNDKFTICVSQCLLLFLWNLLVLGQVQL
jgi:hypothetical protein